MKKSKWIETVVEDFISKGKFSGTLTDKQFQTFSNNMNRNTSDFYARTSVNYTYKYKGYKFSLFGKNKFTLVNENNWEVSRREEEIERLKRSLETRTKRGLPQSELDELTDKIKELEKEIEIYLGA